MKSTEDIWLAYHKKLSAFIRYRVSGDVVDDILQDVFMKIHAQVDSLKDDAKLESWLYRITRNAVIDHYRSKKPKEDLPKWIEEVESDEGQASKKELLSCLEPMIKQLPDKYRLAIELSELQGESQKVIAERENISLSGAKSRVQRGRTLLKVMLYECCEIKLNQRNQLVSVERKRSDCENC